MVTQIVYLLLTLSIFHAWAANILCIFIAPSFSHQMPLLRLSKSLAARGHNLTVITTHPSKVPVVNHTEIDVSFAYDAIRKHTANYTLQSRISITKVVLTAMDNVADVTELQLKSEQVQNFLRWGKDVKFDLVLYENVGATPYLAYVYTIGSPPVIGLNTIENNFIYDEAMGCPTHTAYQPTMPFYTDHMTFFDRIMNTYYWFYVIYYRNWIIYPRYDNFIRELFGDDLPSSYDLDKNKTLLMYTGDGVLGYPKPLTPNIVQVGPLHIMSPKVLPEDLEKWIDGAKDGVIYFSLGGNMKTTALTKEMQNSFLSAFKQFPNYRVIWKWDSDTQLPGEADNILFQKWIPQQDLLAHNKVRIFISQCGLQSTQEAIHFGVNIICTPLYRDQIQVSRKVVDYNIGMELDIFNLSNHVICKTLKEIITNLQYKENIQQMSALVKDRVLPPLEQAAWWVEYVLRRRGTRHLRPATLDLHWIQYFFLDIALFFICFISATIFIIFKVAKIIQRLWLSKSSKVKTKSQ